MPDSCSIVSDKTFFLRLPLDISKWRVQCNTI